MDSNINYWFLSRGSRGCYTRRCRLCLQQAVTNPSGCTMAPAAQRPTMAPADGRLVAGTRRASGSPVVPWLLAATRSFPEVVH